jgi:hypothetical protein
LFFSHAKIFVLAQVFLDVDFLGGSMPETHLDVSDFVLCYCSRRWFTSWPCVREIIRTLLRNKPCITVLEADKSEQHGGVTEAEVRQILLGDEYARRLEKDMTKQLDTWKVEWDNPNLTMPSGQEIIDVLFASPPVVWYSLSDPQDVSMRLIAERLVPGFTQNYGQPYVQIAYVQDELERKFAIEKVQLAPFAEGCRFHLYVSEHNPGAHSIAEELQSLEPGIQYTTKIDELHECEHMMVLLSEITWTRGEGTNAFAAELVEAMRNGVHRFLIHEVPGARLGDNEARHSCSFDRFFMDDTTPKLIVKANIYNEIAMNLAGDEWRKAGLIKTVQKLAKGGGEQNPIESDMQQELDSHLARSSTTARAARPMKVLQHGGVLFPLARRKETDTLGWPATTAGTEVPPAEDVEAPAESSAVSAVVDDDDLTPKADATERGERSAVAEASQAEASHTSESPTAASSNGKPVGSEAVHVDMADETQYALSSDEDYDDQVVRHGLARLCAGAEVPPISDDQDISEEAAGDPRSLAGVQALERARCESAVHPGASMGSSSASPSARAHAKSSSTFAFSAMINCSSFSGLSQSASTPALPEAVYPAAVASAPSVLIPMHSDDNPHSFQPDEKPPPDDETRSSRPRAPSAAHSAGATTSSMAAAPVDRTRNHKNWMLPDAGRRLT